MSANLIQFLNTLPDLEDTLSNMSLFIIFYYKGQCMRKQDFGEKIELSVILFMIARTSINTQ